MFSCVVLNIDVASIVRGYLELDGVRLKNTAEETFIESLRVFLDLSQTPISLDEEGGVDVYYEFKKEFKSACLLAKNSRTCSHDTRKRYFFIFFCFPCLTFVQECFIVYLYLCHLSNFKD